MHSVDIINGDCLDVMRGMDAGSVDAIVTDPPYELANDGKAGACRVFLELMFPKHPQVEPILTGGDQLPFLVSEILQLRGAGVGDPTPPPTMPVRPVAFDNDAPARNVDVEDASECPVLSSQSHRCSDLETESAVHIGDFALKLTDPIPMLEALDSVGAGFTSGAIGIGFRVSSPGAPRFLARERPVVFGHDDVLLRDGALANAIGALAGTTGVTVSRFHLGRRAQEELCAHGALVLCSALLAGGAQLIRTSSGARRLPPVLESRLVRIVDRATNRALTFNLLVHPQSIASAGFMGKSWDGSKAAYDVDLWTEALRVAKPGAHLLAFGGTRTYHRLTCAIEDAGWEIRDCIMWVYGSGFPKSLDVSKAIDKAAGAEREVVGSKHVTRVLNPEDVRVHNYATGLVGRGGEVPVTAPATPEAARWQGFGTSLKPAYEPIIVARKPLDGNVAANVLRHGTGAINVDGCRVQTSDKLGGGMVSMGRPKASEGWDRPWMHNPEVTERKKIQAAEKVALAESLGRWPANLILTYPEDEYMLRDDVTPDQLHKLAEWMNENAKR